MPGPSNDCAVRNGGLTATEAGASNPSVQGSSDEVSHYCQESSKSHSSFGADECSINTVEGGKSSTSSGQSCRGGSNTTSSSVSPAVAGRGAGAGDSAENIVGIVRQMSHPAVGTKVSSLHDVADAPHHHSSSSSLV